MISPEDKTQTTTNPPLHKYFYSILLCDINVIIYIRANTVVRCNVQAVIVVIPRASCLPRAPTAVSRAGGWSQPSLNHFEGHSLVFRLLQFVSLGYSKIVILLLYCGIFTIIIPSSPYAAIESARNAAHVCGCLCHIVCPRVVPTSFLGCRKLLLIFPCRSNDINSLNTVVLIVY